MNVYEVPVPERFLPLVYRALADAYQDEGTVQAGRLDPPAEGESATEWSKEEVIQAYRESTFRARLAFDYLADNPEREVMTTELARVVYPNVNDVDARNKLYGVLGAYGRRLYRYGKQKWFFAAEKKRNQDGSEGRMVYIMPSDKAAWLREARESE
jgi:hypothetical protein